MIHPQTATELQSMIDHLDSEMSKLRVLLRQGEAIRAELAQALAALVARNEP